MFPSSNNGSPISNADATIFHRHFLREVAPNSKQEDPPPSLYHFPSPFIHCESDEVFLLHHHELILPPQPLTLDNSPAIENVLNPLDSNKSFNGFLGECIKKSPSVTEPIPRKRSLKRDRHSKINTAQGPRDRRMRLSLEIARKFFDLQDMLGYDKASKTVEWLLKNSRPAIKELARNRPQMKHIFSPGAKSTSSTSECEVVSGIDETVTNTDIQGSSSKPKPSTSVSREKRIRHLRKTSFHPLARESREKARARARERTREKMWSRKFDESTLCAEAMNKDLIQLGCWSPFETGEESGNSFSHNKNTSLENPAEVDQDRSSNEQEPQGSTADIFDDSLVATGKWSPSAIFNYQLNNGISQEVSANDKFSDLPEHWDIDGARMYSSYCTMTDMNLSNNNVQEGRPNSKFLTTPYNCLQHQFADFQFYGKSWEASNNPNLY